MIFLGVLNVTGYEATKQKSWQNILYTLTNELFSRVCLINTEYPN